MAHDDTEWTNDGKYYFNSLVASFTLRRGYLRIDYSPTVFGPGSITFSRDTSDPTEECHEITEEEFRTLRSQVTKLLQEMYKSHAADPLPTIELPETSGEQEECDDYEQNEDAEDEEIDPATTQLLIAAAEGDIEAVRSALAAGADVNGSCSEDENSTGLSRAVENGHLEIVSFLLEQGADISSDSGQNLWRRAFVNEHYAIANLFAEHGVETQPREAMLHAAHEGRLAVVEKLLNGYGDLNEGTMFYWPTRITGTPLTVAAAAGRADVVEFLLNKGADPDIPGDGDVTAWLAAAAEGNLKICTMLESCGAKRDIQAALVRAAQLGNTQTVLDLLERGANPTEEAVVAGQRLTPLMAVAESNDLFTKVDHYEEAQALQLNLMKVLLDNGADPNVRSSEGRHPLFYAVDRMNNDMVSLLLEHNSSPDPVDRETGETPLFRAAADGNKTDIARLLLNAGANPNAKDRSGQTPVQRLLTSEWGQPHAEFVFALAAYGADLDVLTPEGKSVIDLANQVVQNSEDEWAAEQCQEIVDFLDNQELLDEYGGALARPPQCAEDCLTRAKCAMELLQDGELAVSQLVDAVRMDGTSMERVISYLSAHDWESRYVAAVAMGRLGNDARVAIPHLIECFDDEDDDVALAASCALVEIGVDSLPALKQFLQDCEPTSASLAARTIVEIDSNSAPAIIEMLQSRLPANEDALEGTAAFAVAAIERAIGSVFARVNNTKDAIAAYQKAVYLNPNLQTCYWTELAELKMDSGDSTLSEAIEAYQNGQICADQGEYQAAVDHYRRAIDADSTFPWGYNNLAWLSATCDDPSFHDAGLAITNAAKACELTGYRYYGILDTLAAAYAASGDFDKAVEVAEKALGVAPPDEEDEYRFTLERYRVGLPWAPFETNNDEVNDSEIEEE